MTNSTAAPATTPHAARSGLRARLVVDAPVRAFHWLFALSFLGAYLTADGERWRALHVTLGYTVAGLLVFRVLYGLWGPAPARLALMQRKLAALPAWLRASWQSLRPDALTPTSHWRQGQNLLLALAIVALLLMMIPVTLSGYATYDEWGGEWIAELHELFSNIAWMLVLAHLALIVVLSVLRKKNLAQPMLTGTTDGPGPDLVKQKRTGLALLVCAAVLAFWAWQWQQSPQGLFGVNSVERGTAASDNAAHDDD